MSITPIKSSIQAPPTARDVSATLRSVRGHFLNLNADQQSRLFVSQPEPVWSASVISQDLFDFGLIGFATTSTATPVAAAGTRYKMVLPGAGDQYANIYSAARFSPQPGRTTLISQKFFIDKFGPSVDSGEVRGVKVGFFRPRTDVYPFVYNGIYLERIIKADDTEELSICYQLYRNGDASVTRWTQDEWNVDQLQLTTDLADNPSRSQIDWNYPVELVIALDSPNSALVGFNYDGVFLPAHRIFSETIDYMDNMEDWWPLSWQLYNTAGGTGTGPEVYSMGASVMIAGDSNFQGRAVAMGSPTYTLAAGATSAAFSISQGTPHVIKAVHAGATGAATLRVLDPLGGYIIVAPFGDSVDIDGKLLGNYARIDSGLSLSAIITNIGTASINAALGVQLESVY